VKRILATLAVGVFSPWALAAEPSTGPPADPEALLREAAEGHPSLAAARSRLEASRHAVSSAKAPQDPEVSVAYTNDSLSSFTLGDSEFSNLALTWTQEIRRSGKRRQSGEVAARSVETAEKTLQRVTLEILSQVKIAYADLLRVDKTVAILGELRQILDSVEQTARRRYEVGEGNQESVLKAQTRLLRLEAELTRLSLERAEVEARLNAAVGRAPDTPLGPATVPLEGALPPGASDSDRALENAPAIGELEAEMHRAEASAQLARWEEKPDYLWSASYQYRGDFDPMVMGMFGMRLPLYKDRKQAQATAQADAEVSAARSDLARQRIETQAVFLAQSARIRRSEQLLSLYRQGIVSQAQTTFESGRASYAVGRLGLQDLLNDLEAVEEARKEEVAIDTERMQALAALEPIVGRELLRPAQAPTGEGGEHAPLP